MTSCPCYNRPLQELSDPLQQLAEPMRCFAVGEASREIFLRRGPFLLLGAVVWFLGCCARHFRAHWSVFSRFIHSASLCSRLRAFVYDTT